MDKLMMNKLDDMELDMVAGGRNNIGADGDEDNSPLYKLGRKMNNAVVNGGKAVVNGVKAVGNAVDNLLFKIFGPKRKR